jgi:hypothetical protein
MSELVSMREYARRRNVSAMAVSKAAKAGRITLVDGKVDVATADRDWPDNTNPGQLAHRDGAPAAAAEPGDSYVPPSEGDQDTENGAADSAKKNTSGAAYGQARAIREGYAARLAKINYEKEVGALVSAEEVRVAAFKLARTARDQLMAMVDQLAPIVAAETNPFEVHRLISEHVRRISNDIANAKPV